MLSNDTSIRITPHMISAVLGLIGIAMPLWYLSAKFTAYDLLIAEQKAQITAIRVEIASLATRQCPAMYPQQQNVKP